MVFMKSSAPKTENHTEQSIWLPYCQMKTARASETVVENKGVLLQLADGRQLIDGIASWWTACHGYNHPQIVAAICQQAQEMSHVMLGGLIHEPAARLANRLADQVGLQAGLFKGEHRAGAAKSGSDFI